MYCKRTHKHTHSHILGVVGSNASRINNSAVKFIIYQSAVKKEIIQTTDNKSSKISKIKTILPFDTQFYVLSLEVRNNLVRIYKSGKSSHVVFILPHYIYK